MQRLNLPAAAAPRPTGARFWRSAAFLPVPGIFAVTGAPSVGPCFILRLKRAA